MSAPKDPGCYPLPENFFTEPLHNTVWLSGMDITVKPGLQYIPINYDLNKPYWEPVFEQNIYQEQEHKYEEQEYHYEEQEYEYEEQDSSTDYNNNEFVNNTYNTINEVNTKASKNSTWKPQYTKPWTNSDLAKVGAYSTKQSSADKVYQQCYAKQDRAWKASIKAQRKWKK